MKESTLALRRQSRALREPRAPTSFASTPCGSQSRHHHHEIVTCGSLARSLSLFSMYVLNLDEQLVVFSDTPSSINITRPCHFTVHTFPPPLPPPPPPRTLSPVCPCTSQGYRSNANACKLSVCVLSKQSSVVLAKKGAIVRSFVQSIVRSIVRSIIRCAAAVTVTECDHRTTKDHR